MAAIAGIVGLLLCALVPLLPVRQTTATVLWPQGTTDGHVTQITAPLVSGAPRALDISIPCAAIATLPPSAAALAYGTARTTMSPAGAAPADPDSGAAERGGQFLCFGRVAADDLDCVAACERPVGQGAGHVPQADDADAAHEVSRLKFFDS